MPDMEKVIKGIDICLQRFHCGEDCPYYNDTKIGCMEQLREDALAMLKEQDKIIQSILREKNNELNSKITALQIEIQNRKVGRLLEQK